jgi:predicted DNA-binding transcriptional regulator YafY
MGLSQLAKLDISRHILKMRSSRLLEMLLLLQSRGQVTAAELARRLEVSTRTVYRDAEALSAAGVPVYAERGRGGGIALLPGYRTDVTGLTKEEARALFVLTTGEAQADLGLAAPLRSAIAKVMRAVPGPFQEAATAASQRILIDPQRWLRAPEPADALGELQDCVFADRRVHLGYRSSGQAAARVRTVDPYGLVCKAGVWYLVADSHGEPRLYRVSRVTSVTPSDEPARRRAGVDLAGLWAELRQQVEERPGRIPVRVRVRRSRLDMLLRICAQDVDAVETTAVTGQLSAEQDGECEWVAVRLRFPVTTAARILLSFGVDVEVLAPAEVRDDLGATAAAVAASYLS